MRNFQGMMTIVSKRELVQDVYEMILEGEAARFIQAPGQFINIKINDSLQPYLRRPMSICDYDENHILGGPAWSFDSGALLAKNVNTVTGLSSYDDFLTPSSPVDVFSDWEAVTGTYNGEYTVIDYKEKEEERLKFTAFVLPAKMELAVRFLAKESHVINYYGLFNGQIYVDNRTYEGGEGATGIISPDAQDNVFYFRRNHKYVLTGTSTSVLSHELD